VLTGSQHPVPIGPRHDRQQHPERLAGVDVVCSM
jgi:hypothetical protein